MALTSTLRIVCLSDTHGLHHQVQVPDGDILIHAGDLTVFNQPLSASVEMLRDVNDWLGELPHRHKVVIAGNHDIVFRDEPEKARSPLTNAHYLENSGVTLEGLRFWGSPVTPVMESMAFATPPGMSSRAVWDLVPADTDVLITHGPPYGTGDQLHEGTRHQGCLNLTETVLRIRPKMHVFGHIHGGYGQVTNRTGTRFINCAAVNNKRILTNAPVVVDCSSPNDIGEKSAAKNLCALSDQLGRHDMEPDLPCSLQKLRVS